MHTHPRSLFFFLPLRIPDAERGAGLVGGGAHQRERRFRRRVHLGTKATTLTLTLTLTLTHSHTQTNIITICHSGYY